MNYLRGLICISLLVAVISCHQPASTSEPDGVETDIRDAFEYDFQRTYDPALGYPPRERLLLALQQIKQMRKEMAGRRMSGIEDAKFVERGPNNIGGRTRTIVIDVRDPERKTIWVGSVSGGLWKTTDVTADDPNFVSVDDFMDCLAIGSLAQDPTNPEVFYAGTGEGFGNSEAVRGVGIFKSEDGGVTWNLLPSTANTLFSATRALVVHPVTGDVYAATQSGGVQRSQDGGQTWIKVLGVALTASDNNMYDLQYAGGQLFASNTTHVYSSDSGDRGMWTDITRNTSGFPTNLSRVEFSVCNMDINTIMAVGADGGSGSNVYRTQNGGQSWTMLSRPGGGDFTNGQAWYDLEIAIDPFDCNHVIVGGVAIYRSKDAGLNWQRFAQGMHVDQHRCVFDPEQPGVVYFGNDGGFWRSSGGSDVEPDNKNMGYVTTQYYGCAIHPDTFSNYFLGGTQDNGSHRLNGPGAAFGTNVWGGDGFYAHIDQLDPNYQMVSSQFGNWGLSTNGGVTFSGGQQVNGGFVNPSDYDSKTKILYTQTSPGDFDRWNVVTNLLENVDISGSGGGVTAVHVDINVDNRVYFGTGGGTVVRVDSANQGSPVPGKIILVTGGGTISGIDVFTGDPNRIIVARSNYGVDNVMVTSDGGDHWSTVDGNLPDMPVRDVIFSPKDKNQAMIATEAGVWTTAMLDGANTIWIPPSSDKGIPLVRTDDLEMRTSDNVVLAGTHGRGLWTSSVFADPKAKFYAPLISYVHSPVQFFGDASLNADSYNWTFGDGQTSTEADPVHTYDTIGEYDVTLTINGTLSTGNKIKILPDGQLPYVTGKPYFGGDFEGHTEQYGAYSVSGSKFERGNSTISGKNGTKSGDYAYVLGLEEPSYQPNTEAYLYLPVFDLSQQSIYTFSFWARYLLHPGPDGFYVQYSLDRGSTWQPLGSSSDKNWYNFNNADVQTTAFPDGTSYFTGDVGGYTHYTHDLTFLSGHKDVAFRFQFRSEATGHHVGLAIDDVEIQAFQGALETAVTTFSGSFGTDKAIDLKWSTNPEWYCRRFEIERSINGRDFEKIDEVQAKGVLSATITQYDHTTNGGGDLYFYRMKVINQNTAESYYYEFYTDTITIRRNANDPIAVHSVFPNPFVDKVNITFEDVVNQRVYFKVYDAAGRLVDDEDAFLDTPFYTLTLSQRPEGVYYLSIQIADNDPAVYSLMRITE